MGLIAKLMKSPVWLMVPTIVIAVMVGLVVTGYDPLTFDPALVKQAQAAQKANLKTHDAEKEATGESVPVGTLAPPSAVQTAAAPSANLELADGTWTGYAACGQGNPDGWKPYYVAVTIQVKDGKVVRITNVSGSSKSDSGSALSWDPNENQAYLDWADSGRGGSSGVTSQINSTLSSGKSVSGVDTVSGATYSSVAIYNAYVAAVNKAAKANGNKAKSKKTKQKKPSKSKGKKPSSKKVGDDSSNDLAKSALADGSWIGYAACGEGNEEEWSPYYVAVSVEVSGGKVQAVKSVIGTSKGEAGAKALNWKESENKAYLDWASNGRTRGGVHYTGVVDQITASIKAGAIPASIDTVSGATYSSEAIFRAFYAALKKSAAAAGSAIDEPSDIPPTQPGEGDDTPGDNPSGGSEDPSGGDEPSPGGDEPVDALVDGTYSGHAFCRDLDSPSAYSPYYIIVEIEVAGGRIAKVSNVYADSEGVIDSRYRYDSSENSTYLDFAINGVGRRVKGMVAKMQEQLDAGGDPTSVDVVSSATWSSKSIVEAYKSAAASVPLAEDAS